MLQRLPGLNRIRSKPRSLRRRAMLPRLTHRYQTRLPRQRVQISFRRPRETSPAIASTTPCAAISRAAYSQFHPGQARANSTGASPSGWRSRARRSGAVSRTRCWIQRLPSCPMARRGREVSSHASRAPKGSGARTAVATGSSSAENAHSCSDYRKTCSGATRQPLTTCAIAQTAVSNSALDLLPLRARVLVATRRRLLPP